MTSRMGRPPVVHYPSAERCQLKTLVPVELKCAVVERAERTGRTIEAVMESLLRREFAPSTAGGRSGS